MVEKKSYNGQLVFGICAIISGLFLLMYSIASYSEVKLVTDKIDFDMIDNNNQISISDKYYKYLSIWDTLNQKLEKNKNLPIKNMSCAYLDYAQHNVKSMYKLVFKSANEDLERRSVVEGNIKTLSEMYNNYTTCRKTALYQEELKNMLDEIENSDEIFYQGRMDKFISGERDIERVDLSISEEESISDDVYLQSESQIIPLDNSKNPKSSPASDNNTKEYRQVEKYIETNNNNAKKDGIYYGDIQTYSLDADKH